MAVRSIWLGLCRKQVQTRLITPAHPCDSPPSPTIKFGVYSASISFQVRYASFILIEFECVVTTACNLYPPSRCVLRKTLECMVYSQFVLLADSVTITRPFHIHIYSRKISAGQSQQLCYHAFKATDSRVETYGIQIEGPRSYYELLTRPL